MMGHTHMLGGAAGFLVVDAAVRMPPAAAVLGTGAAAVAALVPDIDAKNADITRAGWIFTGALSWVVRRSCGGHRQITHSLLGIGIWSAAWTIAVPLTGQPWWLLVALAEGYISHVAMDMLTKSGCPVLWPDQTPWHWLPKPWRVTTGGKSWLATQRRRGRGRRRRWRHNGAEYWLIQPACFAVAVAAGMLVVQGH